MIRTVIFLSIFLSSQIILGQSINRVVNDEKGTPILLGKIDKEGLTKVPFNEWFQKNYKAYIVNSALVKTYKASLKGFKIKIFLGTWCGDSKREVPRFYKVLENIHFPLEQLEVVAVDRAANAYKQSPTGEEKGLNIHRVPTFVFYKDGQEVNRIVESPKSTFEYDIKAILEGKYIPNYRVVSYLEEQIRLIGIEALKKTEVTLIERLSEMVNGSRELNTYGYVKLRSNSIKEALYIFDLNTKLFPYRASVYDSLGEAYFEAKDHNQALKNYYKVLSLHPDDENAKMMIGKINGE